MDAQKFLSEFGHIVSAPGGISLMRDLVLSLAVTGKLVEQNKEDSDVKLVLERLALRRTQILQQQNISATRKHKNLGVPQGGFQLPTGWEWEFLGYLSAWPLKDGDWIESKDQDPSGNIRIIQLADIGVGQYRDRSDRFITEEKARQLNCYFLEEGDVLIARLPDPLGRACIFPGDQKRCVTVVDIAVCRCDEKYVNPKYLVHCINSPFIRKIILSLATGTTRQRVATGQLGAVILPVPPVEEQARIVDKIDELMALCDKLEVQQQRRKRLQDIARKAVIEAFERVESPHELLTCWSRLSAELNGLFEKSSDVADLRGVILELAALGKLSELSLLDSPAAAVIEESISFRRKRIADGSMKIKRMSATDVSELDIPAPEHWAKASLEDLFQFIDYRGKTPAKTSSGVVLVTAKNVRPGALINEPVEYISEQSYREWMTRGFPREGDLLITTEAPLGNVARIDSIPSFALAQRVIDLQPFTDINTKFFMYFMMSPSFQKLLLENSTGMTAKGIKAAKLKQLMISVPPREEQDRIVQRVEQLLEACRILETQLDLAHSTAAQLARASFATITGIRIEEEEELKAPKTELISKLRLVNTPSIKEQAPLAAILARHHNEMAASDLWQRYGGEIDAFYAQLKLEVGKGWIEEPSIAEMRVVEVS